MPKTIKNNFHHLISDFLKVNATLLVLLFVLVLIGLQKQSVCDKVGCFAPKVVEDEYTISNIQLNEKIGDKNPLITSAHLSVLGGEVVSTGEGATKYAQYIRFAGDGRNPITSGTAFFGRDSRGMVNDYLRFDAKEDIYEYGVVFEEGLQSGISDKKLANLITTGLTLLGDSIYVLDATVDVDSKKLTLKLVDAAFSNMLAEGQEKVYDINGKIYTIKILIIDMKGQVKLVVNGYETKTLRKGDIAILPDSTIIGIAEVLMRDPAKGPSLVKFYLGSTLLEATDKYSDVDFSYDVRSQNSPMHTAKVQFIGSVEGTSFVLNSMKFRVEASSKQGDVYLPAHSSLREQISEPDAMFPSSLNLVYNGFGVGAASSKKGAVPLEFAPTGDGFNLRFSNLHGMYYNIPFISARGGFSYGDGRRILHFREAASPEEYSIAKNDLFVVTSQNNDRGTTNVLSYDGIDTATKRIFFRDLASGEKTVSYEQTGVNGQEGKAMLNVGGRDYPVFISSAQGNPISADLNGDGAINSGEANVILANGGRLDISPITGSAATLHLIMAARLLREATSDETTEIRITKTDHTVDIDVPNQGDLRLTAALDKDILLGQTKFGTLFQISRRRTTSGLFVDFPKHQALASATIRVRNLA